LKEAVLGSNKLELSYRM